MRLAGALVFLCPFFLSCSSEHPSDVVVAAQPTACVRPGLGESRIVMDFSTPIPARYRLSHRLVPGGTERYEAMVSVGLHAADSSVSVADVARLEAKLDRCLKALDPYLQGPDGERLIVRRSAPGELAGPAVAIGITSKPARGHARLWRSDWGCAQIVHEVFHLMGLVDEYREPVFKAFDCRAVGPDDSLMSYPQLAYERTTGWRQQVECSCAGDEACRAELDSADPSRGCPAGARETVIGAALDLFAADFSVPEPALGRVDIDTYRFSRLVRQGRASLLLPAQFRAVVEPGCTDVNETYYACAADAYRTSPALGGKGCGGGRPSVCGAERTEWLGVFR